MTAAGVDVLELNLAEELEQRDELLVACREVLLGVESRATRRRSWGTSTLDAGGSRGPGR